MSGLLRMFWMEPPVRAVILLTTLMVSALVGGTAFLLYDLRQRELEYARAEIESLSRVLAEQTSRTLDGVSLSLRGAQERLSDGIGQRLELDSFPVQALLRARAEGLPQYSSMFVLDANGEVMNSTLLGRRPGITVADQDFFSSLVDGNARKVFVSRLYRRRVDDQWTFYLSMRLVDGAGHFRGVTAVAVLADYFESFYRRLDLRFGKQVQLIDARGHLVASFPSRLDGIDQPVDGGPFLGDAGQQKAAEPRLMTETASGGERFVAYHPVPQYPFVIGVSIDQDAALVSWPMAARPILFGAGAVAALILAASSGMIWSMRRRATMARALQASDERLRQMVETVMDAIVTVDEDLVIVLFNKAAEQMFGVTAAEVAGKPFAPMLASSAQAAYHAMVGRRRRSGERERAKLGRAELTGRSADAREFPVDATFSETCSQGQRFFTVVLRDLTERKNIETHLRETNRQLQELSTSLQQVREEERASIAREMHDELGQLLTGIRLELSWLASKMPADRTDLQDKLKVVKGQLNQTISSVRRITYELRPLILDDLGLHAAISWLTDDFSKRTGVEVVSDVCESEPEHGSAEATTLFRVLQESLTNVTKYAKATTVWVDYRRTNRDWCLTVRDDGVGFALGDPKAKAGFGLVGMRERVRLLQGSFTIESAPGEGTVIDVAIPVSNS
ncbi:cache domain-containing protein [Azoarcus sp. KH32C]|uniref:PAS domain S-box protein n=1 Tax=Azoarcus sp. KH32C TaxID=748247 RepID=UPI00034DFDE9|nr:cache domain-containing protein [Azoarcus sp. KH32C]